MGLPDDMSRLQMSLAAAESKASMLDVLPIPVIEIDRDYAVAYINPAGATMLGVNRQHVIGMNSHNVLRTAQCHAGQCMCQHTVLATHGVTGDTVLDPSGLNLPIRYTAAPVEDDAGHLIGTLVAVIDIQSEHDLAEEVQTLTDAVGRGDVSVRGNAQKFDGHARCVVQGMNDMLESMSRPITLLTRYVDGITRGEFSDTMPEEYPGQVGKLQQSIQRCIQGVAHILDETNRTTAAIMRGKLDRRADSSKYPGQWAEIARGLNESIESLLSPVREMGRVLQKVASGNLKARITTTYQGDYHVLKVACNDIGSQLQDIQEVMEYLKTAVTRGQLNSRGELRQLKGQFADVVQAANDIVDAVNIPLVMMTDYIERLAEGILPGKIIDEYKGNFHNMKTGINSLIDYLQEIARAADALTHGDMSVELAPRSENDSLTQAVQQMIDTLQHFHTEIGAVADAVGEGRLNVRGNAAHLQGEFTKTMRNINRMVDAVTKPLQLASDYIDRIASGNIPARLTDTCPGDFAAVQQRMNCCIDTLNGLVEEVANMSDAATRGDWDVRADVAQYEGLWSTLVKDVNSTAEQVSSTIQDIGSMLHRLAAGDFEARLTHEYKGDYNVLKSACNDLGEQIQGMHQMVEKLHEDIADGHFEARMDVQPLKGEFSEMMQNVNGTLDTVSAPVRELSEYVAKLASGELPESISAQYQGELQVIKNNLNALRQTLAEITQLAEQITGGNLSISLTERSNRDELRRAFVTMQRSLRNVLTETGRQVSAIREGRLGFRGNVMAVEGRWRELVSGVNSVVDNFTTPMMLMTEHVNRVAAGDTPNKVTEEFRGEFNGMRNTVNRLIDETNEVKLVMREIAKGNLDVQVKERSEKDEFMRTLHEMVASVRAIADAPETLAKGWRIPIPKENDQDGVLGNTLRQMATNFQSMMGEVEKSITEIQQQNWLKSGQTELESILREEHNAPTLAKYLITFLVKYAKAHVGAVYLTHVHQGDIILRLTGSYAYSVRKGNRGEFALGEGLIGQAALEREMIVFSEVPEDYVVSSGLGRTVLRYILVMPLLHAGELTGVIELGTVREFSEAQLSFLRQASEHIANAFYVARDREPMQESLEVLQQRAELRQYQEDLRLRQEELAQQVLALQDSREKLHLQEGELRGRHTEMDTQAQSLRDSEQKLQQRQQELRLRQGELEAQARELRQTEQTLQQQQQQLQSRYADLESQTTNIQQSDQKIQAQQEDLKSQAKGLRESEQKLQQQREKLRKHYEELESRVHMLQDSEQRVNQQRNHLRAQYEDVESRAKTLREFEEKLQHQQEKLQHRDQALSQRVKTLEQQQQEIQEKQQYLDQTKQFVQEKMKELEFSGRYRPEFLVNMSYKLRTSLNRLLVLSNLLAENKERTLTEKQVEFAQTMNTSVSKLLALINQVLHLMKVESGRVDVTIENVSLRGLVNYIEQHFLHMAQEKGLFLNVEIADSLPVMIKTVRQHIEQVLKHLVSNAVKFTEQGNITVHIGRPEHGVAFTVEGLNPQRALAITVADTGIGIPEQKLDIIFDAFQQADSTISRRFGGMGLGLPICRGLARVLGGEIQVRSAEYKGSTFTLYIPEETSTGRALPLPEHAVDIVRKALPEHGIERGELEVPSESLRPRPITEQFTPADPFVLSSRLAHVLVVDGEAALKARVTKTVNGHSIVINDVTTGRDAYRALQTSSCDCLILNLDLADVSGDELLDMLDEDTSRTPLPVIIYTSHQLHPHEEQRLRRHTKSQVLSVVTSHEQLAQEFARLLPEPQLEEINLNEEPESIALDEDVTRELQQVEELLMEQQHELRMFRSKDAVLNRRTLLVVSRDRSSVYTLTNVFQEKGAKVLFAENETEVMQQLESRPEVDLVLIENALSGQDGCDVTRTIRQRPQYAKLPIIALMTTTDPEDYQRCLDAGANDYLFKPVDTDELVSLMRVWLY